MLRKGQDAQKLIALGNRACFSFFFFKILNDEKRKEIQKKYIF